ncbi:MAG: hypothetical protein JO340_05120 [Acidobacteriaceae bacterium]|nr:hypothetical protein [Acidobacteriaceae bacterium]
MTVSYKSAVFHLGQSISAPITGIAELTLTAQGSVFLQSNERAQTTGDSLPATAVTAIPLNKRDFSQLLLLAAGTMTDTNGATNFTQQFAINGQRGVEAVFAMDGALTSDPEMGGATMSNFNVDAVEEIQSQSGWMPADIGFGAAGFTNIVTRSGADSLHGSLFEFLRNSALDARNFFDRETPENPERIPPFRRNEFGGTLGGMLPPFPRGSYPTAFFIEYQGFRQVLGTTQVLAVPTAAERAGIDTTAFPGDTLYVPVAPKMADLLQRYPLPNDPSGPFGARTFATSSKLATDADQFSARIDRDLTSHDRLFARFTWDDLNGPTTNPDQTAIDPTWGITYIDHQRNAAWKWSHTPSASFSSQSELSFTRTTPNFPTADHTDPSLILADGLYEPFDSAAGSVTAAFGNLFEARQDVTWIRGAHTLQAGGLFSVNRDTTYFGIATNGQYTFGGGPAYATAAIPSASGQHNIAVGEQLPDTLTALLLGSAFSYTLAVAPQEFPQSSQIGVAAISRYGMNLYWKDTWKITPNLALDYGLRYEIYSPLSERAHRTDGLRFLNGPDGPQEQYLINPEPRYRWRGNNWGPRARLSWQPAHDLWLHAGASLATIPPNIWQDNFLTGAAPYVDYPRLTSAPGSPVRVGTQITPAELPPVYNLSGVDVLASGSSLTVPANTIWNVNRFEQELASATGTSSITPLNANAISQDFRNAYLGNWTFSLERALHGVSASAAYIGTAGIDLPGIDFPNGYPGATPQFAPYTQFNSAGQITGGFGTDMLVTNRSHSTFHSLQTSLTGAIGSRGPQVQANFTWSKSLDDTSSVIGPGIGSTSGVTALAWPQNPFDTSADKGPSTFDVERVLTFTAVQDLQADGAPGLRALPRRLTRGWQLLNISTVSSGLPFTVYSGVQQTGVGSYGADRPDQIGSPHLSVDRTVREDYFGSGAQNASFFALPIEVPGGTGPNHGAFGTLGRDTFRGPALYNFDFAIIKDTPFEMGSAHKSVNLQFRGEFFNLFNVVNFGLPSNVLSGSGFGIISRTAGTSRQIQFSMKVMF